MSTRSNKSTSPGKESNKRTRKPSASKSRKSRKLSPVTSPSIVLHKPFVERLTIVHQGFHVYRVKFTLTNGKECIGYVDNSNKHVIYKRSDGTFGLFHLEDKEIKESFIESCRVALTKLLTKYKLNPPDDPKNTQLIKDVVLLQSCEMDLNLAELQSELDKLNKILNKTCPHLTIRFSPYYAYGIPVARYTSKFGYICIGCNYYDIMILALCSKDSCISTIEMRIASNGEVSINSKTDPAFEGNKYNKMMRFVLFIMLQKINGVLHVKSEALNPISAKLLLNDSDAILKPDDKNNEEFLQYLERHGLVRTDGRPKKDISLEEIRGFYTDSNKKTVLHIPINAELARSSYDKFVALLKETDIFKKVKC